MSRGNVLVTPRSLSRSGHPLLQKLRDAGFDVLMPFPGKQPTEDQLMTVLPGCVGYLAGVENVSARLLSACPDLKVISRNGVGLDNVDQAAAKQMGIEVKIARGANSRGVAELTIALVMSLVRFVPQTSTAIKRGAWDRRKGIEVSGRTLGIVGTGQVGRLVARLAHGLDMKVIGYDLYPDNSLPESVPGFVYAPVDVVLGQSDIVTLHCPAGDAPVIDQSALELMRNGAFLVNTARASLVDQPALLDALESGKLAGYAVDAFDTEPPELTPVLRHDNVILTAHVGGFTEESVARATDAAIRNLLDTLG